MEKKKFAKKSFNITVVILNIVFLIAAFWLYTRYTYAYEERLREENIVNVSNMNNSALENSTALFDSYNIKLKDIEQYIENNNLTLNEALDFICASNSSDDRYFQLVGTDFKGFLAHRDDSSDGYIPIDYSETTYSRTGLQEAFKNTENEFSEIRFVTEFTDAGITGAKFFAVYRYVTIEGQEKPWTLMLATKAKYIMEVLNTQASYEGQATVLINSSGNFIVNNKNFSSSNLFDYIRDRNNLSLKQRNKIEQKVIENKNGELYYKKLNGAQTEDFIFHYEKISSLEDLDWYCVTCVPISSFKTPDFNSSYIIYIIIILFAIFAIDIVWLNSMNRRLKAAIIREQEASLAKGSFLSRMSHEIRTPLNAIIGYNTIARNEISEAKNDGQRRQAEMKAMDCLEKSGIASKHLLTIINDVLDMSAIENNKIKIAHDKFDFKGLITSLTTVFYSQARAKGVKFEVIFGTLTEEWFVGDQMRTNQILTNLLSNAIKFTPENGQVTLEIFQPEAETNASHIHFKVSDTGIGMTEEYMERIWAPFEQADSSISRRFGGTGLGLSITKNLVDLMNGSITVKSTIGKGTTFEVDLCFEPALQPSNIDSYDFSKVNALAVDDDLSTCDYIRLLFNRCGAKCATVTSGEDAIKAVSISIEQKTPFSLCIVDWRMPKMDGIETIRRIRDIAGNNFPIVILTAYDYTEVADEAGKAGITKFISKPLFQSSIFDMLLSICGKKQTRTVNTEKEFNFNGARVLLAEDNEMNMEIAKKLMTSAGLCVDSAWNGKEAVEMFTQSENGFYKAILMDVHMPELNGLDATRTIRKSEHEQAATIPIIAMTADAFAENVAEALDAGMNDHIAKPIDLPILFSTLEKYI